MNNLRVRLEQMYVGSLEYASPYYTFAAEYTQFEQPAEYNSQQVTGLHPDAGDSGGYYVMLSVPMPGQENLVFSALYDAYYSDLDDKDGTVQSGVYGAPDYYYYREDFGVGARLDISDNWLIKAEWHEVEGADLLLPFFNQDMNPVEKDWSYYIVKTSFNF